MDNQNPTFRIISVPVDETTFVQKYLNWSIHRRPEWKDDVGVEYSVLAADIDGPRVPRCTIIVGRSYESELLAIEDVKRQIDQRKRPKIIVLCGSTKFGEVWKREYARLSDEGNIVLTVARLNPDPNLQHDEPELKARLDILHKRKIDLADEVFVLNVSGYIGQSTSSEIAYATSIGKPIVYLEPDAVSKAEVTNG